MAVVDLEPALLLAEDLVGDEAEPGEGDLFALLVGFGDLDAELFDENGLADPGCILRTLVR